MKDGIATTVHVPTIREFIHAIAAQAKAATAGLERPGLLQMSRLHPTSETLVPSRFTLDDIERMIETAICDAEAGHNCYLEGRMVRPDLRGSERGKLEDSVAVFALISDSDADKGMGWTPTATQRPSMTIETSPGNFHFWYFLREAVDPALAKKLGERMRHATNGDHNTGTPTQPYRVAGTPNYPSKKKIERGRTATVPTRLIEFDLEVLWTPEDIEAAFPIAERKTDGDTASTGGGTADEASIPDDTMRVIREGVKSDHDRSNAFYNVVVALTRLGFTADYMVALFEQHPDGIAQQKYEGRIRQETERIYNKIKNKAAPHGDPTKQQQQPEPISAEALEKMIFPPIKYIVPEILVEGLTLFASKPKMGKSWLLLHAAIAVATGGFTLGELHCNEGDVLYCALEDSERRLKGRIRKLGLGAPKRLFFWFELPRLVAGGLDAIRKWIMEHPEARLVVIDILAMVREARKREETTYDADYQAVIELRNLANEFGIAIVVVHHTRKADAEDAFDTVSGTLGLTGAPDSILIIKRNASGTVTLHGKGRDLIEVDKAIEFNRETCVWTIVGEAAAVKRSTERTKILAVINEATEPIGPNDIAVEAEMRPISVRKLLPKLVKEGLIEKVSYGRYQRVGAKPAAQAAREPSPPEEAATAVEPLASWEIEELRRRGFTDLFGGNVESLRAILANPSYTAFDPERYEILGDAPRRACKLCFRDGGVMLMRDKRRLHEKPRPLHPEHAEEWFAKNSLEDETPAEDPKDQEATTRSDGAAVASEGVLAASETGDTASFTGKQIAPPVRRRRRRAAALAAPRLPWGHE